MKVLLIDDHALFREGLESLLSKRGLEVCAASGAIEGIEAIENENPDIVLMDLKMPKVDGIKALKTIRDANTSIAVVLLTTSDSPDDLRECLTHDANGYLLKDMDPDDLVMSLRRVHRGELVVAPELTGKLAQIIQNKDDSNTLSKDTSAFSKLTRREKEILGHLAEGQSNKVIARHLDISEGTVKLHVKSILRKLEIRSRVEAAVMAVNEGITLANMKSGN